MRRWGDAASRGWVRTLAALWFAQVVAEMAFSFALPFVPLYVQELGVEDLTEAGLWAGAMTGGFAVVMAVLGPVWGQVADRHGRRLMIQRAIFGAGLFVGLMSLVQTPEQLLVLRVLQGSVTGVVAATTTVVSLTTPNRHLTTALGFMHAALFIGGAVGPIVGGLVSDQYGYRAAFAITGGLFLVAGVLVTLLVAEPPREPGERTRATASIGGSMRAILGRPELLAVIVLLTLIRFASMAPQPVLPLFIQQITADRGQLATLTGAAVAITGAASMISALAAGHLVARHGRTRVLLICLLGATLLCAAHAVVATVWQLLILRAAIGLALGGMLPAIQAMFTDLTPAGQRGMAFGLLATASAIGNGGGPVLGSVIAALLGVPAVFLAMAPLFLVGAWLLLRLPAARPAPA